MNANKNDLNQVRQAVWDYVQIRNKPFEDIFPVTRAMVDEAVFLLNDKIVVSGEANNFSCMYVDYYDGMKLALSLMTFIAEKTQGKFKCEWYSPAFFVAYKQYAGKSPVVDEDGERVVNDNAVLGSALSTMAQFRETD